MEKYYLSKEKIKELKGIINRDLGLENYQTYKNIRGMIGEYQDTIQRTREAFFGHINREIFEKHKDIYQNMVDLSHRGKTREINELVLKYIIDNYKKEWDYVCTHDMPFSKQMIDHFCHENFIMGFGSILAISEYESVDKFLEQFEKKNMDPELVKRTEIIKKNVDNLFQGIPYKQWEYAIIEYLKSGGEEHKLNNIINQPNE